MKLGVTSFNRTRGLRNRARQIATLLLAALGCLSCLLAAEAESAAKEVRVLFIGNSLTRRQDMPFLLEQIARNKGKQLVADYSPCRDGYKLAMHANTPQTMEAIRFKPWDYVVLQEHGLVPIRNPAAARRAVARFHEVISAAGARTILFEHSRSSDTNGAARVERQQPLSVVFQQIATELNVRLAPVGPAFVGACRLDPTARLFEQDHVHPSSEGAYLAACVLYATIFNETPAGTNTQQLRSPNGTLVMDLNAMGLKARLLEQAAWRAVRNRANGVSGPGDKPESNTRDQTGVGQLMKIAVEKGNASRPGIKLGICGEHGGDPDSVKFCDKVGLTHMSCSPFRVPVARLAAAQAALEEEAARKTKKK